MLSITEILIFIFIQIMIGWIQNKGCKWIDDSIDAVAEFLVSIIVSAKIDVDDEEVFQKRIAQSKRRA